MKVLIDDRYYICINPLSPYTLLFCLQAFSLIADTLRFFPFLIVICESKFDCECESNNMRSVGYIERKEKSIIIRLGEKKKERRKMADIVRRRMGRVALFDLQRDLTMNEQASKKHASRKGRKTKG